MIHVSSSICICPTKAQKETRKQQSGLVSDDGAIVLSKASKKVYSPMLSLAARFRPMTHHSNKNRMAFFQTSLKSS